MSSRTPSPHHESSDNQRSKNEKDQTRSLSRLKNPKDPTRISRHGESQKAWNQFDLVGVSARAQVIDCYRLAQLIHEENHGCRKDERKPACCRCGSF